MKRAISASEKSFIVAACKSEVRYDGRDGVRFRPWSIENNVLPHVHGSARLTIGDSTSILAAVKLEVIEAVYDKPNEGQFEVGVDISPSCNVMIDERRLGDTAADIAHQLQRVYSTSGAFNLKDLCIVPGKYCWCVHVDIMILHCDALEIDVCSVAAFTALQATKVPKVEVFLGESGKGEDFEISSHLGDAISQDVSNVPICVTACKLGGALLLDPSGMEISCADALITVAVNSKQQCCGVVKHEGGVASPVDITDSISKCVGASTSLFQALDAYTADPMKGGEGSSALFPDLPPKRLGYLA
jgi:exosome complex component RRP42